MGQDPLYFKATPRSRVLDGGPGSHSEASKAKPEVSATDPLVLHGLMRSRSSVPSWTALQKPPCAWPLAVVRDDPEAVPGRSHPMLGWCGLLPLLHNIFHFTWCYHQSLTKHSPHHHSILYSRRPGSFTSHLCLRVWHQAFWAENILDKCLPSWSHAPEQTMTWGQAI